MKVLICIPAYNEEKNIKSTLLTLSRFLKSQNKFAEWNIIVADNASTDLTQRYTNDFSKQEERVKYFHIKQKGKGNAIKQTWMKYEADIYCFMDADLSTDILAIPTLLQKIENGNDISIGSRHLSNSKTQRSFFRKTISKINSCLIQIILKTKTKDTSCGFKAINNKIKKELLPLTKEQNWFFDTELVILAEKNGYKINEIPVNWNDLSDQNRKSNVNIYKVSKEYIKNIFTLRKRLNSEFSYTQKTRK